jgi:undecaprenyl-diphosphatase
VTWASRTRAVVGGLLGVVVLVLLGVGVLTDFEPQLQVDAAVSEAFYAGDDRAATLNGLLEVLTAPGLTWVRVLAFLPLVVWLLRLRAGWTAAWVLTAVVLIAPLTSLLKDLFGRLRPPFEGGGARYESLSYPSGHSSGIATLVAVALVLAWPFLTRAALRRLWLAVGVVLVLLVGLTRMWLGVHYLSDVIGGWALGLSWTLLTAAAFGALAGGRAALPLRR